LTDFILGSELRCDGFPIDSLDGEKVAGFAFEFSQKKLEIFSVIDWFSDRSQGMGSSCGEGEADRCPARNATVLPVKRRKAHA
jgi:hypothetical protein